MTATDSPLAPVVRKGTEAIHGTYGAIPNRAHIEPYGRALPPRFSND